MFFVWFQLLGNYQESARDLTDLLKIEPSNAPAKKELDMVKDAWRKVGMMEDDDDDGWWWW